LYAVEALCPAGRDGDEMRRKLRAERSRPVIARLRHWATTTEATPESGLAKAIDYMAGMWTGLTRFLDEPRLALDNNLVERALRDPVLGRKNFYGSKSKRGLEVAGLFYTVLHSAKFAGVEPKEYLRQAVRAALQDQAVPLPHEIVC
jgi:transposase